MSSYNVPDPPPGVPPGFDIDNYVAKLNPATNQFDIYPRVQGKYTQQELESVDPITGNRDLKLGPPSRAPDWHPVVEQWGLQVMGAAGFINSTAYRTPAKGQRQMPTGRLTAVLGHGPIHPVLREDMWHGLRAGEYALMEPAIRLASAILDDPETLRFFAGITVPSDQMPYVNLPHIGKCPIYGPSQPLDATALTDIYKKVTDMRGYMAWEMQDMDTIINNHSAFGLTKPWVENNGKVAQGARGIGTRASVIYMSRGYTDIMRMYFDTDPTLTELGRFINDTQWLASTPIEDNILISEESAIARSTVLFVDTLIHELTHAICGVYFDVTLMAIPGMPQHSHIYEPFFAGDRCNETGHAISSYIFRGNPTGICHWNIPQNHSSLWLQQHIGPLGLHWADKWDKWKIDPGAFPTGQTRAVDNVDYNVLQYYTPVPQAHINKMLSTQLWQDEIYRFGLDALRMPRLDNWSVGWTPKGKEKGCWGTGRERWNDGPAPVPPSPSTDSDEGGVPL
ncbi:hypothetical protein E4T48_00642 [Aureobasidium sp. EXF-10727]|nr:hypothetical protein E4T48_00642 [Aureobasidium sp. EXF-10727]KAI4731853.1 hypothetical protein E4T49_00172 [Aureobasidium sp. EXF-10728]